MKLLIDTNVVLDFLGANVGFADEAEKVFNLAIEQKAVELVSASAVTDIYYVLRRTLKDKQLALQKLSDLRRYLHVLPVTEQDIDKAIARNWHDFEDAVQYSVAESNDADYIITRNGSDFEEKDIPSLTPSELLSHISSGLIPLEQE